MRIAIAATLGALAGWAGPGFFQRAITGLISSASDSLSWAAHAAASVPFGATSAAAVTFSALAAALGVPALLAAVCEGARGDRSARTACTVVLVTLALVCLAAPVNSVPFALAAILCGLVVTVVPRGWSLVPIAFVACAVSSRWLADAFTQRQWLAGPASSLDAVFLGPASLWVLTLVVVSATLVGAAVRFLFSSPRKSRKA